jgi:hypothetical protein
MNTEHPVSPARDTGVENLFETVFKGYAKRQVEDYVAWLQEQVSAAKAELSDARRELAVAREDLVDTRAQLQTRPQHEEISVRMAQILRLAEEEAQQERDHGTQQAAAVLEQARSEARAALEAAHDNADEIVRNTRLECDDELAGARAEANRLVETAQQQAEATMSDARERAQRSLADADRRTEQITTLQQRRLATVLAAHEDVVRRLESVRAVVGEVLGKDREQGDPGAAVDAAPLPAAGTPLDPSAVQVPPRGPASAASAPVPVPQPGAQLMPELSRPFGGGQVPQFQPASQPWEVAPAEPNAPRASVGLDADVLLSDEDIAGDDTAGDGEDVDPGDPATTTAPATARRAAARSTRARRETDGSFDAPDVPDGASPGERADRPDADRVPDDRQDGSVAVNG